MQICMDWRSVKFDWNKARAFLVTAEEGSLSAAARALGMAQPTLGRQVDGLEQELGIVLFERVGRGLTLTPSGLELLDHVRAMGEAAGRVSLTALGQSQALEGTICISASETYASVLLPPIIKKLRAEEPGIQVEVVVSNHASDLRRREADIAIRNFRPTEPDLIARKVGDADAILYATPDYIASIGHPTKPYDLRHADFINMDHSGMMMKGLNTLGLGLTEANFPLLTESYIVMWELVRQGAGIGILDAYIGDAEPCVRRVLPDLEPIVFPIWLVAHRELTTNRRIRRVFDFLAQELRRDREDAPLALGS
ncbi:LysR family transcriptional regulator [Yoonia sediminilitoris]|uniref:LysR family transcriptional regulator n=1 Tax=Yoonia sediminilitoris TaxID=1286148 RepID=A0A2T6KEX0_9RHOB|nr:LysR family transcriptional regulator [Yoonia sediminilitoris]PUB13676.1 LysR family transcriptional regulator [Yoonia sediminilitoris]RCW94846.1 LysR family transcriptional regulator [Yoonia sediminilitoris]